MKSNFKIVFADRVIFYALLLSILGILLQIGVSAFQFLNLPPVIPLFNSLSWGEERLIYKIFLFGVPLFLLFILILNLSWAARLYRKNALLARILVFNVLLGIFLSCIALVQIFFLVF